MRAPDSVTPSPCPPTEPRTAQLLVFWPSEPGGPRSRPMRIREHLLQTVVPSAAVGAVVVVDHLPVTEQGKPDRPSSRAAPPVTGHAHRPDRVLEGAAVRAGWPRSGRRRGALAQAARRRARLRRTARGSPGSPPLHRDGEVPETAQAARTGRPARDVEDASSCRSPSIKSQENAATSMSVSQPLYAPWLQPCCPTRASKSPLQGPDDVAAVVEILAGFALVAQTREATHTSSRCRPPSCSSANAGSAPRAVETCNSGPHAPHPAAMRDAASRRRGRSSMTRRMPRHPRVARPVRPLARAAWTASARSPPCHWPTRYTVSTHAGTSADRDRRAGVASLDESRLCRRPR